MLGFINNPNKTGFTPLKRIKARVLAAYFYLKDCDENDLNIHRKMHQHERDDTDDFLIIMFIKENSDLQLDPSETRFTVNSCFLKFKKMYK